MANEDKFRDYLKLVTANLRQARRSLREVERRRHEPIAVVGMGCRFPGGVNAPGELWRLLADGGDAICGFPDDRGWDVEALYDPDPDRMGTSYSRHGGFLRQASEFDAGFFGISPREALAMDPQQRLMLEVAWEALERSGIDPQSLKGSPTGVFAGAYASGYGLKPAEESSEVEGHLLTGMATSVLSGRIAFSLGLVGPTVTVDTACSSALVALHLACQSLRSGECDLALAGGVTVIVTPTMFVEFSRQKGMSVDGRCRSFAAAADGSGWAEGAGLLVVERLSDARRNGHPVLAVVRGSAINQDGASNGLTAPNGPAQQRVIRAALANAQLGTADIDVVEAHGSATTLGDPIEAQALLATYGQDRPDGRPLYLGSVKSNIGHTQAAAGAAGLIKTVLALQNQVMPRTLHAEEPSPHIDWSAGQVRLLQEPVPWEPGERTRRAGVSSFGISGTNAHVILEEAPGQEDFADEAEADPDGEGVAAGTSAAGGAAATTSTATGSGKPDPAAQAPAILAGTEQTVWLVSGRSVEALAGQAGRLREFALARPELAPADVAWSLATSRSAFDHRAVVAGADRAALVSGLAALATGQGAPGVTAGSLVAGGVGRAVFVFPGQGSQWAGMGRELLADSPVFAARLAECAEALAPLVDWSLLDVIENAGALDTADVAQPVMWAVMVSLAALWQAAGVNPEAVIGHSQGEIAAATVAGILSLQDGAKVVVARSKALAGLNASGGLLSVVMPESAVVAVLEETGFADRVTIAAVNSPAATVVSGTPEDLDAFEAALSKRRILRWRVPATADFAAHSPRVEPIEDPLRRELAAIRPAGGDIAFYSTAHGRWLPGTELDAGYWYANVRERVRFADAVTELARSGHRTFLELSAQPVLTGSITETVQEADLPAPVVSGTVTREAAGAAGLLASFASVHVQGVTLDWRAILGGDGTRVDLPTYAFQHRRFWLKPLADTGAASTEDDELWSAVQDGDVGRLAETLALDADRAGDLLPALASWRNRERADSAAADWRYRVSWSAVTDPDAAVLSGTWLAVVPEGTDAEEKIRALTQRGAEVITLETSGHDLDRAHLTTRLTEITGEAGIIGVLSFLAWDDEAAADTNAIPAGLSATLVLVQALGDADIAAPLWTLTRGAVSAAAGDPVANPRQAQVWGLGRVVALEHPERWGGLVDLPAAWDDRTAARLIGVLAGSGEDQVAVREPGLLARRLVRAPQPIAKRTWSPSGTVLVTGGTGALGRHVARWLAGRGAERIVLASRSGATAFDAAALATELAAAGASTEIAICDVTQATELRALLHRTAVVGPPLTAVFHLAGVSQTTQVADTSLSDLAEVSAAKTVGARLLDELTTELGLDLDAFVLFSSAAATWGGAQQPGFAAANAHLDALAEARRAAGRTATTIAWGPWAGEGIADGDAGEQMQRRGLTPLDPARAVAALGRTVDADDVQVTIADVDWEKFAPTFTLRRPSPLIEALPEVRRALAAAAQAQTAGAGDRALADRVSALTRSEQDRLLTDLVRTEAAAVLKYPSASAVEPNRAFSELGFDSLTSVELRNRLGAATGLRLPATLLFDYPTSVVLAEYLRTGLLGVGTGDAAEVPAATAGFDRTGADEPIAIIGLGCRFPGGIATPEDLWELLASGGDAIGAFPTNRGWDIDSIYDPDPGHPGTSYVRHGGFLHEATDFDAGFFGISPREALAMDPQQRLLLEVSWEALERAGIDPHSLRGTATGVFAGASFAGYGLAPSDDAENLEAHLLTGTTTSVISGRVSYTLGLEGPAVTVDTACSSTLVALHLACQALRTGECSLALAGGAFVSASPELFVWTSRQRGLAQDGRCKSYAGAADGMGISEGAGMILVERLADARRNGHPVLAVVRGSAVNQDGASNGLTAPNGPSQQRVIRAALANARIGTGDVDVVEGHGSGTTLGDPIEAQAVIATYGQNRPDGRPMYLGSVKSNIGHAQAAAGSAGVIKMVMALRNGLLPQTLHIDEPSPHIDWSAGEVRLLTEAVPWPADGERPRRAGVSSFGVSGTNAHIILEEAPGAPLDTVGEEDGAAPQNSDAGDEARNAEADNSALPLLAPRCGVTAWPVSGRSAEGLTGQAGRLREFVLGHPELDTADVAWSLATSRSTFEHRSVVVGADRGVLAAGLAAVATGQSAPGVVTGSAAASGGRIVFVFPGQGSQWAGMGRELLADSPVFAARLAECAEALAPLVDWSLLDVIENAGALDTADVAQPVMWAVMVSLAALWQAAGVNPEAVIGHSQGEIAAATVAGILSLEDGAKVVVARSQALAALHASGGLLSVVMPEAAVLNVLQETGFADRVTVAAVNSPAATVVSGTPEDLDAFEIKLSKRRILRWRVPATADFAAHSPRVEPIEPTLREALSGIRPADGEISFYSTAHGRWMSGAELDAGYWYTNVREQVRFAAAVGDLAGDGFRSFVEISAQPTLTGAVTECLDEAGATGSAVTGTLGREDAGAAALLTALARAHASGVPVDWRAVLGNGHSVPLPTYAFQRRRYWMQGSTTSPATSADSAADAAEARFWAAVEDGDLREVADELAIDGSRPLNDLLPALASWRRRERADSVVADWRYHVSWVQLPEPGSAALAGAYLLALPAAESDDPWLASLIRALTDHGAQVVPVPIAVTDATLDRETLAAELATVVAGLDDIRLSGVLSVLSLDETPYPGQPTVPSGVAGTLLLLQALGDAGISAPLRILTTGAVATGLGEAVTSPVPAEIWGLGRVIALEHPDRWGGLIDLPGPASWDDRIAHRFCGLLTDVVEDQIAVRGSGILGRRLVRAAQARRPQSWSPGGTVLITGGTGAIGGHVGRWLTGRGAQRIVLTSRSGAEASGVPELAAALAGFGTDVVVASCDTSQRSHIAGVLERIAADGPPLSSVIHSAGVLDDGVLDRQNVPRLATTLGAKAAGAAWLDELTREADLDAFVVFSSAAATFGGGGQGNYAAANAYLDGLVEKRRAAGLPGLSVAWGPWAGGGVSQATDAARARLRRNKWEILMAPELAVRALGQALDNPDEVTVTVIDIDWAQLCTAPAAAELRRHPMVRDLPDVVRNLAAGAGPGSTDSRGGAAEGELARRLSGLLPAEQDRLLTDLVRAEAAAVLNYPSAEAVEPDRPFSELGFDSLTSVELRNQVSAATGLRLPATLLFDYPTPTVLAAYLRAEMVGAIAASDAPGSPAVSGPALDPAEPLAIVGMGCRFPGGVRSPEDLWRLLESGAEGISPLPADRGWDVEALYHPDPDHAGTSYVREGGYVQRATEFDPAFFAISPREALAMDPQQRLLLETSWEALERAGIDPHSLRGSRTGVFVGGYGSGYEALGMAAVRDGAEGVEGHLVTGNATSILSGRVSYTLGLEGPAVTVDTACSSSLVAMHLAGQALRSGECRLALVSGVTIMATPRELIGFSRQRGLAADGRSKAFSAEADGMGMGEGVGTLIVERLSDARRNGHPVLAVVRGSAVNQDGASNGLTAPNGPSQQRVIRAALASAQLAPADVDAVEAHGTGTPLGDPIEAQALMATYGRDRAEDRPLWLGSVKSNIGHAQAAAGVAGIIKVVLAMRHELLPRTLHVEEPSPHIDWTEGDVRLLAEPVPWPAGGAGGAGSVGGVGGVGGRVRRAGVSGFGISGTNAHVIVEEAPEPVLVENTEDAENSEAAKDTDEPKKPPVLAGSDVSAWVISGRGSEGLAAQAARLREFVLAAPVETQDVAYTLAACRARFDNRAVVVGRTREELTADLAAVATKQAGPVVGVAKTGARVGFLFAGQGAQRAGMGRSLYAASPVFAESFDRVAAILEAELGLPVADVVLGRAKDVDADQTVFAQTGLFAVQVALVEMLTASGVRPDAVAGHSVGEIAAAWAAGVLSLEDACRLVAHRARLMQSLPEGGAMCAIAATEDEVLETLTDHVGIAAVNGPMATVVSGDTAEVEAVAELWRSRERRVRPLRVSHAFHSAHMDPILDELGGVAGTLTHVPAKVTWAQAASGEIASETAAGYWTEQARQPVRFADAVNALADRGVTVFVEIGPDGTLSAIGSAAVPSETGATFIPLLRSKSPAPVTVATALARAHVLGIDVDWTAVLGTGDRIDLPTYAFQHQRFWPQVAQQYGGKPAETAATGAEAEFWSAVEDGDVAQLADALAVDGDRLADLLPALASWRRREREDSAVADWRYRVAWAPIPEPAGAVLAGSWLVVAPNGMPTDAFAQALRGRGADLHIFDFTAADLDRAALTARLAATIAGLEDGTLGGVISLLAHDMTPLPDLPGVPFGVGATLVLAQALGDADITAPLWALTRGAVATGQGDTVTDPLQGQIWGLGRVVGLEHPERWGGLIDLPQERSEQVAARLCAVLATPTADTGEDQIAIRAAGLYGRRLIHAPAPRTGREWQPRGSVLITGGTGAIGGHVGRWLAGRGAERVVLCSRSGPAAASAAALAADLANAGTAVDIVACDTTGRAAVQGLLGRIAATGPALTAVLHTAGVGQATYLADTTLPEQEAVCGAKAAGAALLDELTRDAGLDAFVVFSSIAAIWGSAMQPGYATANAYLDAMMANRRAQGLLALSVAWGPWGGGGMTAVEDADRMVKRGLKLLDPRLAVQALAQAIDGGEDLLTVVDVDWAAFAPLFTLRRPSPLIEALPEVAAVLAAAREDAAGEGAGDELAEQLAGLSAADQDRVLVDLVRAEAARALGYPSADAVEPERAFSDLGFDSLTGVELRNRLTAATGRPISATVVFDYPTPVALAGHLRQAIAPAEPEQAPLLAELDRLESLLSTAVVPEADSGKVTARLEAVMTKWKDVRGRTEGTAVLDKLEASSDDEIFDFLGEEFGIR